MATMRFVHVVSGFVLIGAFALRVYWFFKGNFWSRWSAYIPIHREQWQGMGDMLEFYLFLRFDPGRRVGHNPLAALTYFIIYLLILVEILTGLALYSRVLGNPVLNQFIGWLPLLIEPAYLRLIHFFLMFVFFAFVIFHVYASVLVSIEEENGLLDSIFSGWKFVPAGELRHEIAAIPEARRFAKRHQLLPRGTPAEERAGGRPEPRPGPGPVALYRNWISLRRHGHCRHGRTRVRRVDGLSHHRRRRARSALWRPGHLLRSAGIRHRRRHRRVDRHVRPVDPVADAQAAGVRALSQVGPQPSPVRERLFWRSRSEPRSSPFQRFMAAGQAYLYTDAVSFCGATCHSMTPEYVTYRRSPHAHVACAQCHVGPGATGYIESKVRGMVELVETIQNDYPRPIPVPVRIVASNTGNCEKCHWPANFFGSREVHRVHFLSDEQNTRWEIDMLVQVGGGAPADASRMGIHWHVASKVEYRRERCRKAEYSLGAVGGSKDRRGEGVHLRGANIHHAGRR